MIDSCLENYYIVVIVAIIRIIVSVNIYMTGVDETYLASVNGMFTISLVSIDTRFFRSRPQTLFTSAIGFERDITLLLRQKFSITIQ